MKRTTRMTRIEGRAMPLPIENLDTDQIMPKQFLRIIDKAGLADGLFYDLRFESDGSARADSVFHDVRYGGAKILIGSANFGCGSSREHAVWGLQQYGFEAVVAPSFAEIFYSNAMTNRLLLISLPEAEIESLMHECTAVPGTAMCIDLEQQVLRTQDGTQHGFSLSARHKRQIIEGIDTIDFLQSYMAQINAFEVRHFSRRPWLLSTTTP